MACLGTILRGCFQTVDNSSMRSPSPTLSLSTSYQNLRLVLNENLLFAQHCFLSPILIICVLKNHTVSEIQIKLVIKCRSKTFFQEQHLSLKKKRQNCLSIICALETKLVLLYFDKKIFSRINLHFHCILYNVQFTFFQQQYMMGFIVCHRVVSFYPELLIYI